MPKKKSASLSKRARKRYSAPKGSKRAKLIGRAQKLYKSGNKKAAFKLREKMEEKERAKKSFKNKKSKYSKKRSAKGKKSLSKTLSEKAKGSKFTAAQLRKSYNKGLAAYGSSGSRKGMTAHQWAMARVNSVLRGGKARAIDFPSKSKKKTTKRKK